MCSRFGSSATRLDFHLNPLNANQNTIFEFDSCNLESAPLSIICTAPRMFIDSFNIFEELVLFERDLNCANQYFFLLEVS